MVTLNPYAMKNGGGPQEIGTLNANQGAQIDGLTLAGIEGSDFSGLGSVNNSGNTSATTFNLGPPPGQGGDQQTGLGAPAAQGAQQPVNVVVPPAAPTQPDFQPTALGGTPIRGAASTRGWAF